MIKPVGDSAIDFVAVVRRDGNFLVDLDAVAGGSNGGDCADGPGGDVGDDGDCGSGDVPGVG